MLIQPKDVVLFQGDSITDAGRARDNQNANDPAGLGRGYALYAAGLLHEALPGGKLAVHNRGIAGNRVTDLSSAGRSIRSMLSPTSLASLSASTILGTALVAACPRTASRLANMSWSIARSSPGQRVDCRVLSWCSVNRSFCRAGRSMTCGSPSSPSAKK